MEFLSHEELDASRPKFALLPHNDYKLTIAKLEEKTQDRYQPKEGQTSTEDVVNFTLEVVELRDGGTATDDEDKDATNKKVFFTGRPESMGFMKDGTPAKLRQLIAYTTGQDVEGGLEIEAWEQLLGKTVYAEIIQKPNQKGEKKNRITRFLLPIKPSK